MFEKFIYSLFPYKDASLRSLLILVRLEVIPAQRVVVHLQRKKTEEVLHKAYFAIDHWIRNIRNPSDFKGSHPHYGQWRELIMSQAKRI